jgi:hypothetical protein
MIVTMWLEMIPWILIVLSWGASLALVVWLVWTLHRIRHAVEDIANEVKRR